MLGVNRVRGPKNYDTDQLNLDTEKKAAIAPRDSRGSASRRVLMWVRSQLQVRGGEGERFRAPIK